MLNFNTFLYRVKGRNRLFMVNNRKSKLKIISSGWIIFYLLMSGSGAVADNKIFPLVMRTMNTLSPQINIGEELFKHRVQGVIGYKAVIQGFEEKITNQDIAKKTILKSIINLHSEREERNRFLIVAIDGNSGALKTTTAEYIVEKLIDNENIHAIRIGRDWFIDSRKKRYDKLKKAIKSKGITLDDNEIYLRRKKFEDEVLNPLEEFKNNTNAELELNLTELYNKKEGGLLTRQENIVITRDTVVIIEGNFLLTELWRKYFDVNILMLAHPLTGIKRRLPRDSHTQSSFVTKVFWQVNTPSFNYYMKKNMVTPDVMIMTDSWKKETEFQTLQRSLNNIDIIKTDLISQAI